MKKTKKISLSLNKQVIDQLDKLDASKIIGGDDPAPDGKFLSIFGSTCKDTNPLKHNCCAGIPTISAACTSADTFGCPVN